MVISRPQVFNSADVACVADGYWRFLGLQEEFYGSNVVLMQEKTSVARGNRRAGWFNVVRGAVRQVWKETERGKGFSGRFVVFSVLLCFALLCLLGFACLLSSFLLVYCAACGTRVDSLSLTGRSACT